MIVSQAQDIINCVPRFLPWTASFIDNIGVDNN